MKTRSTKMGASLFSFFSEIDRIPGMGFTHRDAKGIS